MTSLEISGVVKNNKKTKIEHYDFSNTVVTVDQIVEYSWNGGGPFMLQEQMAQYLGVKSFKRKYPNLVRRPVDMQERDYIRDKGLVSEALCDMGLTAVFSADILDIMYSDFQVRLQGVIIPFRIFVLSFFFVNRYKSLNILGEI